MEVSLKESEEMFLRLVCCFSPSSLFFAYYSDSSLGY